MTFNPLLIEMDKFTHFHFVLEGTRFSHDALVRPCTQVQWASGAQPIKLGGNPAGYRVYTGFRVAEGRAFYEWTDAKDKGKGTAYYGARDAWNGVPLWNLEDATSMARKEWDFVATPNLVFAFLARGGPLVALDPATGKVVRTFDQGGRLTDEPGLTAVRVVGDWVIESAGDSIYALEASSGRLRWRERRENQLILFPSVSSKEGKVFAVIAEDKKKGAFGRWPFIRSTAVVSLDLSTGKELWTSSDVAGREIGQVIYSEGSLCLFASGAIGGGDEPFVARLDAMNGKMVWNSTFKTRYNRFGYNLLVRDGTLYYADAWRLCALEWKTGTETQPLDKGR
jgi:outer membrane protein assembly factor BamB